MSTGPFAALREQLNDAAQAFADSPRSLSDILAGIVDDVDRATHEAVEIFPVCHHSPASGLAMIHRLRQKQPKVVYLELCEDLQPLLTELRHCKLPVALQAFATQPKGLEESTGPMSVIAPITEASAEYQAIAYALETPDVELVLVDRPADQTLREAAEDHAVAPDADTEAGLHGDAVGVEMGELRPRFAELEEHLLRHGKVRHWSEWWDQYVEQPLAGADYDTYRQVMVLIGSLFRRLSPDSGRINRDEERERHMWTRIRDHMRDNGIAASDTLYVCGAAHAASRVEEFGAASTAQYRIPDATGTSWLYGLIPSSHSAIEAQFGLAPGSVSVASATWHKAVKAPGVKPFRLAGQKGARKSKKQARVAAAPSGGVSDRLSGFLSTPPAPGELDETELRDWCIDIVRLARKNGYLTSTADSIAVFETSLLLARMRDRRRPTPYDFQDAAITCIEKDNVPGRRDVKRLCEILLGGDRIGEVGYDAMPPLARDVFDRLEPVGVHPSKRNVERVLLDLKAEPELTECSRLLWRLGFLLPGTVRNITGNLELGQRSIQESWDVSLGRDQRGLIELGYRGVVVEQVLEHRLRREVFAPDAKASGALAAVENALLYLDNPRLVDELGQRAVALLRTERSVDDAPEVLRRIRKLLTHFRSSSGVPSWCQSFITTGYGHYCTLLPGACSDEQTGIDQVAAMLGFLLSMENVAIALGCDRTQLEIAVKQSRTDEPAKQALLWAVRSELGDLSRKELRQRSDELLSNPLMLPSFPLYLSGFVQALTPVPSLVPFVVEVLSKAFARLPDHVLLPWLPSLITALRKHAGDALPTLMREAGRTFPGTLPALDGWTPPWEAKARTKTRPGKRPASAGPVAALLAAQPATGSAVAELLGCDGEIADVLPTGDPVVSGLLDSHSDTAGAVAALLGCDGSNADAGFVARHPDAAEAVGALLNR